jgi:AraC-like DNA-binding protein
MIELPFDMTNRPNLNEMSVATNATPVASAPTPASPTSPTFDVLSEVLRALRLRGAVFYSVHATSPWVAETPCARDLAPYVMPGAEHVIEYHVVVSGKCWGGLIGEPAIALEAGDVIVFPQGDAHVMSSADGARGPASVEPHAQAALKRLPIRVDLGGSGKDPVNLVCGFLACDARPFNPLLAALPKVIHHSKQKQARASDGGALMLDHFIGMALAESQTPRAGGEVVLARLSELMFVEVVRDFVHSSSSSSSSSSSPSLSASSGWLSGLRDAMVGRALLLLHEKPAHPWTLDSLADRVGASRSALAQRFVDHVEVPPMQYLAQWRMQLASTLLAGPMTLAQIASDVGYGSEAAFSRAFKKIVGVPPATWRSRRPA